MKRRMIWIAAVVVSLVTLGALVVAGVLRPNAIIAGRYPVRGVDVSEYQGEIDWETLGSGLDFAFVKATEGSAAVDPTFAFNFTSAREAGLVVGAYHFFSFESPGETQAENFILAVGDLADSLPPVVDVELYGKFKDHPLGADETRAILDPLIQALEARYGAKPILYATGASWSLYLKDNYADYPLWIREVYLVPRMPFLFWQYSDKGSLTGFVGPEKHIDLDVFNGSKEALNALTLP